MIIHSPCKDCQKRCELCHDSCPDFLNYRARLDRDKELIRQSKSLNNILRGMAIDRILGNRRRSKQI